MTFPHGALLGQIAGALPGAALDPTILPRPAIGPASPSPHAAVLTQAVQMPAPGATTDAMRRPSGYQPTRGQMIAGILGDMFAGAAGQPGQYAAMMQREHERQATYADDDFRWQRERKAKREDALAPRLEQVGNTIGMLDPTNNSFHEIYRQQQPFEVYAAAKGLIPGSPEYAQAVEDYRLGGWSDPALENKSALEGAKFDHQGQLLDRRLDVQRRGQDMRDATSRRGQNLRDSAARRADTTKRGSYSYAHPGGKGAKPAAGDGPVAELNGQKIVVRNGRWVYQSSGKPVQ